VTFLPIVERELRAEARSLHHHWLRLASALAVLMLLFLVSVDHAGPASLLGRRLMGVITFASVGMTLVVAPLLTADCLSREKREGTLGLLFLTPLTARELVVAKSLVHLLRMMTVLAALAPFLALPLLLGGVGYRDVLLALFANLGAALLGLATGLIASARNVEWMRAVVQAVALEMILLPVVLVLAVPLFKFADLLRAPVPFLVVFVGCLLAAVMGYLLVIQGVAAGLKNRWQWEGVAPPQPRWTRNFAESSFWQAIFRWNKGRTLDRNPIAWLQEYSWTARLTKWGWLGLAVFGQLIGPPRFMWVLLGGVAFAAAASFRREVQSGVLEVLLTTPLREDQIVLGRLWGVICHFLPAVLVWGVFGYLLSVVNVTWRHPEIDLITFASSFFTLTFLGFALSLSRLNTILAFTACLVLGAIIPRWLGGLAAGRPGAGAGLQSALLIQVVVLLQLLVGSVAWFRLRSCLVERRFLPQPAP